MNTRIDEHTSEIGSAVSHGKEALASIRQSLEHALWDITRCEERYPEASLQEKSRIVNHALSTICAWATVNARIGLAADAQAELHAIAKQTSSL